MAYDLRLKCDPQPMPLKPAVMVLMHKRRKQAFVCYSSNARGRAAVLASMIRHRDKADRNHLRDLPEGDIKDFVLLAFHIGLDARKADEAMQKMERSLERKGLKLFGGARGALPKITLDGRRMSIVDAMAHAKTKSRYQTVYRRLQRGWPVKEALDLA